MSRLENFGDTDTTTCVICYVESVLLLINCQCASFRTDHVQTRDVLASNVNTMYMKMDDTCILP